LQRKKGARYGSNCLRFDSDVHVDILAQLIEIKSDRWRNTIEGYMNTQKLYLVVEPEHFQTALDIYNRVKTQKNIYGVRLIDVDRIQKINSVCQPNSLAEEIETDNPMARLYIDYLLGRVIKCDQVPQLRNHQVAVTDEGMLYQGYTVGRIDPKTWASPVIGQSAIQKKIQYLAKNIENLDNLVSACIAVKSAVSSMADLSGFSAPDITQAISSSEKFLEIENIKLEMQTIDQQLSSINTDHLTILKKSIEELKGKIRDCESEIEKWQKSITEHAMEIKDAREAIPRI
jgi:chromosome segregation ATPase